MAQPKIHLRIHRRWIFLFAYTGYACMMNTLSTSFPSDSILAIRPGRFLLVVTIGREKAKVTELIAQLALRSALTIVAGSDWLPGDRLARSIRRRTVDIAQVLERVRLAR